jgi:hypothetical protein
VGIDVCLASLTGAHYAYHATALTTAQVIGLIELQYVWPSLLPSPFEQTAPPGNAGLTIGTLTRPGSDQELDPQMIVLTNHIVSWMGYPGITLTLSANPKLSTDLTNNTKAQMSEHAPAWTFNHVKQT